MLACKLTYNILSDINLIKEIIFLKYCEIKTIIHKYEEKSVYINLSIINNKFTIKEYQNLVIHVQYFN